MGGGDKRVRDGKMGQREEAGTRDGEGGEGK